MWTSFSISSSPPSSSPPRPPRRSSRRPRPPPRSPPPRPRPPPPPPRDPRGAVLGRAGLALEVLVERRGGRERNPGGIVDDLGIDVLARAVDRKPRLAGRTGAKRGANPAAAAVEQGKMSHGYFFLPSLR